MKLDGQRPIARAKLQRHPNTPSSRALGMETQLICAVLPIRCENVRMRCADTDSFVNL